MKNKVINVGIIGYGVVGRGTVKVLLDNTNTIKKKTGLDIIIKGVADRSIGNKIDGYLKNIEIKSNNPQDLINNKDIDIIVEVIGGCTSAKEFIISAIKQGKHIVTANKALLALHGKEIYKEVLDNNIYIGFEASVGGGIPIIRIIKEDLSANNILKIEGIINGTANYILTDMSKNGKSFSEALKDAQNKGYAETDPTFDIEGTDAGHKITLLASIAFCNIVDFQDIYVEGISKIKLLDIAMAKDLNYTIKLLGVAKYENSSIEVRVHPAMIPNSNILSLVNGVFNAISLSSDKVGKGIYYGQGAGSDATGSAIVSDIINISKLIVSKPSVKLPMLNFNMIDNKSIKIRSIEETKSAFYLRFIVEDTYGVVAKIGSILSKNGISIASAIQREDTKDNNIIPLVFMTREIITKNILNAIKEIDNLSFVKEKSLVIRVEG